MFLTTSHIRAWVVILGAAMLFSPGLALADEAVAKVNGEEISASLFMETLKSRHGYAVLQAMIEALAIRQEAAKNNITVSPEEIDARYQEAKQQIISRVRTDRPAEEVFAAWLVGRHINAETFRERICLQMMLERMVAEKVKVTDDEVRQYYETHPGEMERPEAMKISHVCVTTEEKAQEIRKDVLEGRISFEEAANRYSIDPYGRDNGGLLGFVVRGEDPLQQAAFQLHQDGDISLVVQSKMGYHIVRREAYQEPGTPPFEEIGAELKDRIHMAKLLQAADEMRHAIMRTARIERFIQFPQPGESPSSE